MPIGEKSNREMYEEREKEILEELGRMSVTDPNRKPLLIELDTISKILVNYDQLEQNRLNNNAKNDIEEQKLIIEEKKLKNEDKKIWSGLGMAVMSFVGGITCVRWSYKMDEHNWAYKDMKTFGSRAVESIGNFFKRK